MRWSRRPGPPAAVRAGLPLERGERVLAAAESEQGPWVVATDRALLVDARRLAWADVAHAEWDDDRALLSVQPMRREDGVLRVRLPSPGRVPETVRERVTASVVLSRHVPVRGGAGVRVIARHGAASGELGWQVAVDPPLDPDDPQVRAVAEAALADLRRELGA